MSASLSIAAAGLQAAGRRFETAARSVVSPASERKEKAEAPGATASSAAAASTRPSGSGSQFGQAGSGKQGLSASEAAERLFDRSDSAERLINFKRAEFSYKAQIDLLKTVSRHQDEAIDWLA